jgi:hypothetical protein
MLYHLVAWAAGLGSFPPLLPCKHPIHAKSCTCFATIAVLHALAGHLGEAGAELMEVYYSDTAEESVVSTSVSNNA